MSASVLVVGGNKIDRENKAIEIASSVSGKGDILILSGTEESGIANVRVFSAKLGRKPFNSLKTSGIIQEANWLTIEAQNALLKTIEEPNETTQLILTCPSEFSLLSTVSSRCQKIYLDDQIDLESDLPEKILRAKISDRFELSENLDLSEWAFYLRKILRETIQKGNNSSSLTKKLARYIKFVEKVNGVGQIANPRLSRYLVVISTPNELNQLVSE